MSARNQIKKNQFVLTTDEFRAVLDGRKTQHHILVDDTVADDNGYTQVDYANMYEWSIRNCVGLIKDGEFCVELDNDPMTSNYINFNCSLGCVGNLLSISGLELEITYLSIKRMQSTTIADAEELGLSICGFEPMIGNGGTILYKNYLDVKAGCWDARASYETYCISKYGQDVWDSNAWVWLIDFKVVGGQPCEQ